jgi:tetratricopeptide (TPR) repeat protein
MLRRWVFVAFGLVVTLATPVFVTTAHAQEESSDDAARRHFRLGQAHYENGEFAEAATEFDEAYRLSQRAQLLYNVYVAYRDAGDMPHAAAALRSYLDQVPDAENGAQLHARLVAMDRVLAQSAATTTTTTTVATPTDTTTVATTDTTTTTAATTTTDTSTEVVPPPAYTSGGGFGSSPVGWIVGGVGAALIVAGIVTGVMALDAQSSLDAMCGQDHHSCPAGYESTRDSGQALGAATDGLIITGGIALVTGVVLLFVLDGGSTDAPPVSASCGPTGCSAFFQGRF